MILVNIYLMFFHHVEQESQFEFPGSVFFSFSFFYYFDFIKVSPRYFHNLHTLGTNRVLVCRPVRISVAQTFSWAGKISKPVRIQSKATLEVVEIESQAE